MLKLGLPEAGLEEEKIMTPEMMEGGKLPTMTGQELKEKELLYDTLYEMGQAFIKFYNPCKFGSDGKCLASRGFLNRDSFCCSKCKHVTDKGCSVKALACKLSFCGAAIQELTPVAKKFLEILQNEKEKDFPATFRMSKERVFARMRSNNIVTNDLTITKEIVKYDDAIVVKKYDDVTKNIVSTEVFKL